MVYQQDSYVSTQIYNVLLRVVARISARVFVGPDICRNEEWLHTSIHYTENLFITSITLRMVPSFMHSVVAPLLPSYWRIRANLRAAKRLIGPVVRARWAAEPPPGYEKPADLLQSMMDIALPHEAHPDKLAHRQLLLSLASIHTTTMAVAHAIYDACANPQYFEPLRDEMVEVIGQNGGVQKAMLTELKKLDSFVKESQRMNPPSLCKSCPFIFLTMQQQPFVYYHRAAWPVASHPSSIYPTGWSEFPVDYDTYYQWPSIASCRSR